METFQKIAFRQARDFGEILNATFAFLRQNFKKLSKVILFIGGPFILLSSLLSGLYNASILTPSVSMANDFGLQAFGYLGLMLITSWLGPAVLFGVVTEFVLAYMDKEYHQFDVDEIWQATRKDLGVILLSAIAFAFLVGVGMIFCFLPGLYVAVPLSMLMILSLRERKSVGEAISRCFKLVSGHWWPMFGLLIVASIISSVLSFVFYIPNYVLTFWTAFHRVEHGAVSDMRLPFIVTSSLAFVAGYLFYSVPILAICFQYFSLVEQKEAAGLFEKIGQIGAPPDNEKSGSQL
jgi:hypothetical protein